MLIKNTLCIIWKVERTVQTSDTAAAATLLDQVMFTNAFWNWAIEGSTYAHNAVYVTGGASALQHMTGRKVDLAKEFKFPFGTPLAVMDHQDLHFRFQA